MLVRFLTCLLILLAAAIQLHGSIFGHDLSSANSDSETEPPISHDGGTTIVNTTTIAKDIKGYGGPVPLKITIRDEKIAEIETLNNSESAEFFTRAKNGLITQWIGTPIAEAATKDVDAISGATLSSNAINATIKKGVEYAIGNTDHAIASTPAAASGLSLRGIVVLLVVLCASITPLFVKSKYYRYAQLALNVIVLGFWSGTFLSYELFINYLSNGANIWRSLPALIMLVIAFAYPYFGHKSHYCMWVCPLGSLQELAGKCVKYKLKISPAVVKILTAFHECLWVALIFIMIAGIWAEWIDYELFKAFIFKSAALGVVIAAIVVIALSLIVQRPYCRFICPTGYLFQITQNPDK